MLNKKAIAAFAAGATLLSGLAFAAPALAEAAKDASKTEQKADPKHEAAVKAAQDKVEATKKSLNDAKDDEKKAQKALDKQSHKLDGLNDTVADEQDKFNEADKTYKDYETKKNAADAAEKAEKALVKAAYKAAGKSAEYQDGKTLADATALAATVEATKKDAYNAAMDKLRNANAATENAKAAVPNPAPAKADDTALNTAKEAVEDFKAEGGAYGDAKKELEAAKAKVAMYETLLKSYQADLDALLGKKPEPVKPTPVTPADVKAVVEFSLKYIKDAKSDAKTVAAVKAALAKLQAAKDKAAKAAAFKELAKLVEPLMKKTPAEDTAPALKSLFGSDVLYTNYKGLAADLVKRGITNIGAYDALLDKLEFGLKRFGWENIIKNFPEHTEHNLCDFLAGLRRHLTKAVKHYGHVEAAVKDMQDELNEDMKDAQARHDWDAVKVIDQKLGLAAGLRKVAHNNLTRAKALLNSADDHAKDFSCDTQAKDVRKAMDKEPNSPFKKSGQKNDAKKPEAQKPNGGAASHQLGKTGATVALVAVAASVLAGMGAALRKIRH